MRRLLRICAAAALLLVSAVAAAGPRITVTQKLVNGYARQEPLRSGIFGVLAMRGSDTLAQYNKGLKMLPASNTKLITTGLAPAVLTYLISVEVASRFQGRVDSQEVGLPVTDTNLVLPCGAAGRWWSE